MNSLDVATSYLRLSDDIVSNGHSMRIFTITYICKLNRVILIDYISRVFREPGITVKFPMDNKHFHSQMTLTYHDVSRKSIKIFANGSLQITGLSSMLECDDVLLRVIGWLNKYSPIAYTDLHASTTYIAMMNAKIMVQAPLDLPSICQLFRQLPGVICLHNPETYPGLNVKFLDKRITMLIFRTGSVVVACAKSIEDIQYVYEKLVSVIGIDTSDRVLYSNNSQTLHGYSINSLMSCTYKCA